MRQVFLRLWQVNDSFWLVNERNRQVTALDCRRHNEKTAPMLSFRNKQESKQ
ncbi:hypothetical protein [Salibacterium lacus]|uniref:Uncharacterized protein n=1 Tax=Salibacterium lacus TaxID=1898109 RepID=A0ABW5T832_9BACI